MNAHGRRQLQRIADKLSSTTSGTKGAHPTDQKGSQASKADKIEKGKEVSHLETRLGHVLKIAKRPARVIGAAIGFSAAILGLVTGYVALFPRISVSQNEQRDPNDPFSSPFIVSNEGPLPIENVRFRCGIGHARYENGPQVEGGANFGTSFIFVPDANGNLPEQNLGLFEMNPGERSTIPSCDYPFPKSIAGGDIGIVVSFRIWIHSRKNSKDFPFRYIDRLRQETPLVPLHTQIAPQPNPAKGRLAARARVSV